MAKLQGKTAVGLAKIATDEVSSTPCEAGTKKQAVPKAKKPKNPENINKTSLPSEFDVIGGTDIAPETATAVNATIISSFNDESNSNYEVSSRIVAESKTEETTEMPPISTDTITTVKESVEMGIDEKIDLPQLGAKIPPNDELVPLPPKSEIILGVALTELRPPEFHPFQSTMMKQWTGLSRA